MTERKRICSYLHLAFTPMAVVTKRLSVRIVLFSHKISCCTFTNALFYESNHYLFRFLSDQRLDYKKNPDFTSIVTPSILRSVTQISFRDKVLLKRILLGFYSTDKHILVGTVYSFGRQGFCC